MSFFSSRPFKTRSGVNAIGNMVISISGVILFVALLVISIFLEQHLGNPEIVTGYSLLSLTIVLMSFNARKKLPMLNIGRAYWWHQIHIMLGLLLAGVYLLHVDRLWPTNGYERWLAVLAYITVATGIVGAVLQAVIPQRLTHSGEDIIFERIPDALYEIRQHVMQRVESKSSALASSTLPQFYMETLDWFFRKPRFLMNHLLGGSHAEHWLSAQFSTLSRYCDEDEAVLATELHDIAFRKQNIDYQYAHQLVLKGWLFIHVPAAFAFLVLVIWHLILVNIYTL